MDDEIRKALDSGNYEDMYLSDTEDNKEKPTKPAKSIVGYLISAKNKIYKFLKYMYK